MRFRSAFFTKAFNCVIRWRRNGYGAFLVVLFSVTGLMMLMLFGGFGLTESSTVYAVRSSSGSGLAPENRANGNGGRLQAGLMGIVSSVDSMAQFSASAETVDLENSHENLLVGSGCASRKTLNRLKVEKGTAAISSVGYYAQQMVRENQMDSLDYNTLLHIVEAEATGGDMKSKILIANVVLNRVKDSRFPDTIYEVVWERIGDVVQFSPTADGRIDSVSVTAETIEAVDRALAGEDYSQGALWFMARDSSDGCNVEWFDDTLVLLFEYGGHEFFAFAASDQ